MGKWVYGSAWRVRTRSGELPKGKGLVEQGFQI